MIKTGISGSAYLRGQLLFLGTPRKFAQTNFVPQTKFNTNSTIKHDPLGRDGVLIVEPDGLSHTGKILDEKHRHPLIRDIQRTHVAHH